MSLQNYQQSVITRTHTYERNDEMKDDEDVQWAAIEPRTEMSNHSDSSPIISETSGVE